MGKISPPLSCPEDWIFFGKKNKKILSSPDWKHIFFKKIKNWSKFRLIPKNNFFEQKNSKKNDQKKSFFLKCKFEQKKVEKMEFFEKSLKSLFDLIWVIWEKVVFSQLFCVLLEIRYEKTMIFDVFLKPSKISTHS